MRACARGRHMLCDAAGTPFNPPAAACCDGIQSMQRVTPTLLACCLAAAALSHNNPQVRRETFKWLTTEISKRYASLSKPVSHHHTYTSQLSESAPCCRGACGRAGTIRQAPCGRAPQVALDGRCTGSLCKPRDRTRASACCCLQNMAKLVPALLPLAAKGAADAQPELREAAMAFMAAFATKYGSAGVLDKFIGSLDDAKKKRVQDLLAEASGAPAGAPAAAAPSPVRASYGGPVSRRMHRR